MFWGRTWPEAVVRVPIGCGEGHGPVPRRERPDGSGGVLQVHACPWSAGSLCGWIKIEGLDCSGGWQGGPVSESLGFLGFWCIL